MSTRPWREVANELEKEIDQHKLIALAEELSEALDEQEHTSPPPKSSPRSSHQLTRRSTS